MAHTHAFEDYMLTRTNIKKNEILNSRNVNYKNENENETTVAPINTSTENPKWISRCEETSTANTLLYFFWKIIKNPNYFETYDCLRDDILKKIDDPAHISSNLLKKNKITKSEFSFELHDNLSIKGLELLCILYDVSIIFIYRKMYIKLGTNRQSDEKINGMIKHDIDNKYYLCSTENSEFINDTVKHYFYVSKYEKPLKCISSYSLETLQEIAHKFDILIAVDTKNKTKNNLYNEIMTAINKN